MREVFDIGDKKSWRSAMSEVERGAGGTPGGIGEFLSGVVMAAVAAIC
jgi:hypothetical protein